MINPKKIKAIYMANSVKFVLTLMLTAVSAASCLKEIVVQGVESRELALTPQMEALTKAPIAGTAFPDSRTIVLSAFNDIPDGVSGNFFQNIIFKKEAAASGCWTGGGGANRKYWPVSGTLDLLAYSADGFTSALTPVYNTDNWSTDVTLTVPDNSATQVDILWVWAMGKTAAPDALAMTFKHAEAAVAFNAKGEVPYDATANLGITINSITLNGAKSSGKVKLSVTEGCAWSDLDTATDIDLPEIPDAGYNVTGALIDLATTPFGIGNTGIIVIPQTATSFTVKYTVHYGRDATDAPVDKPETFTYNIPSTTWTAGTKYVYQLEFKQDEILVATDIFDWTEDSSGVPVQEPISATFKHPDVLAIDLCHSTVPAKLSPGGVVGIDWGFGRREIIENTTDAEMDLPGLAHTYSTAPTDSVKIHVRRGTLNFGIVPKTHFDRFHVYNTAEVLMQIVTHILTKITAVNGNFTLDPPEGPVHEGETVTVTPQPYEHYVLDKIYYTDDSDHDITAEKSFEMPYMDASVTVTFKKKAYKIFADTPSHGSFTFSSASGPIPSGSDVQWDTEITVTPVSDPGYVVDKVTYTCGGTTTDVEPKSSVYKFKMQKGVTYVTVTFKIQVPGGPDDYDIEPWTI